VAQMVKPAPCTAASEYQYKVSPAFIATALGPVLPLYCVPPMAT
jgi:hypothetical protein